MERLHGQDLSDYLAERAERGEKLDVPEVLRLLRPVADTLEIAHDAGIVHRDLKPENLFVSTTGVRVLDFGFVRFVTRRGLTQPGFAAGSPSYMAPEVWLGQENFDQRVDVYGLGAIVFRALAGRAPFVSRQLAEIFKAVTREPRPSLHALRPDLPAAIDDWVEHALAIDPDARFSRVRAMWNALRAIAERA
jgi:serine/threonine-protein kinase